jgi:glyoxylase-like metal-dependent hydrolase (beta-lactamase superfamily II)
VTKSADARCGLSSCVVQEIDEPDRGLWTFHQPLSVLGAEIGTRMTVVRLDDGGLLVHSPIRLNAELERRIASFGEVKHVVAPNLDHYLFVRDFKERYPSARFYAAPGVAPKLPELRFDSLLEHPAVGPFGDSLDQAWFRSNDELQELVLLHRTTRTLITADLAFNIQSTTGLVSKVMLRLNDSYESFGPSRVCRSHITARRMARSDLDAILELQPDRVIVAHGEVLLEGATDALARGYGWLR